MALANLTFKVMTLTLILASLQVFLIGVGDGLLAVAGPASEPTQKMVLCILQGTSPDTCAEGLK